MLYGEGWVCCMMRCGLLYGEGWVYGLVRGRCVIW